MQVAMRIPETERAWKQTALHGVPVHSPDNERLASVVGRSSSEALEMVTEFLVGHALASRMKRDTKLSLWESCQNQYPYHSIFGLPITEQPVVECYREALT